MRPLLRKKNFLEAAEKMKPIKELRKQVEAAAKGSEMVGDIRLVGRLWPRVPEQGLRPRVRQPRHPLLPRLAGRNVFQLQRMKAFPSCDSGNVKASHTSSSRPFAHALQQCVFRKPF